MDTTYLILAIFFILSFSVRSAYEVLKDAGKVDPENKFIFACIFTVMCVLWVSWFSLCVLDPRPIAVPDLVRWIGFAIFAAGMILALGGLYQLKGLENIDHLVTSGLFSRFRHPMYTGFILWVIGWSAFHSAFISLLIGCAAIANILYWRRLEEQRLLAHYGETYRQYLLKTWF